MGEPTKDLKTLEAEVQKDDADIFADLEKQSKEFDKVYSPMSPGVLRVVTNANQLAHRTLKLSASSLLSARMRTMC